MIIYDGAVDFEFQEKGHRYVVKKKIGEAWTIGEPVVGCTTVCGIINKPALMTYPMNKALEYINNWWNGVTDEHEVTDAEVRQILREARQAHVEHSSAGKKAGKVGHSLVEALLLGKPVKMPSDPKEKEQAENVATAFESWKLDFKPEVIATEQAGYSLLHEVAGTYDLVAKIDGKLTICDFKTSASSFFSPTGLYKENFAQLGGYCLVYEEMNKKEVEQLMLVNLSKDTGEYTVRTLEDIKMTKIDAQLYFLHCLGLYKLDKDFDWRLKGA